MGSGRNVFANGVCANFGVVTVSQVVHRAWVQRLLDMKNEQFCKIEFVEYAAC